MALVIKKSVDLSPLGEEYAKINLVFSSIPAKDLPELVSQTDEAGEENAKVIPVITNILKKYFISGESEDGKVTAEDIEMLDAKSTIYCFEILSGQDIDPKPKSESTSTSTTESAEV